MVTQQLLWAALFQCLITISEKNFFLISKPLLDQLQAVSSYHLLGFWTEDWTPEFP